MMQCGLLDILFLMLGLCTHANKDIVHLSIGMLVYSALTTTTLGDRQPLQSRS
jgi:hypothetical protein